MLNKVVKYGLKAADYSYSWLRSPARRGNHLSLPTNLNFSITDNCNSRCVMCDVWKTRSKDEMTEADLHRVLSDQLFAQIQHVGVSGGEPTLRTDLVEMIRVIVETLPRLRSLSITSHGFQVKRLEKYLPRIKAICEKHGVDFRLHLSVDGIGEVHNTVRGIPKAFDKTMASNRVARELGVTVQWQATISARNVYHVSRLQQVAKDYNADIIFRQATEIIRLDNIESLAGVALDDNEQSFFADFLESKIVHASARTPVRRLFYHDLAHRIRTGADRTAPCYYQNEGVFLTPHGDLYPCSICTEKLGNALERSSYDIYFSDESRAIRDRLINNTCPKCIHDQSGAWHPITLIREVIRSSKVGRTLVFANKAGVLVTRAIPVATRAMLTPSRIPKSNADRNVCSNSDSQVKVHSAVLIGAYGGEHVGDAAILGGVLMRLQRHHGLENAVVLSDRPDRTERWVSTLDLPIDITVVAYERPEARRALTKSDGLVYAGGPLMDLPISLIKHLDLARRAAALNKPFLIEGVGIGPFKLALSRWVARRIVALASQICVRTRYAVDSPILDGCVARVDRDPAFDYLSKRHSLTKITVKEKLTIDMALADTEDHYRVGVNLRPFWHKYGSIGREEAQQIENRFINQFAEALRRFADKCDKPVTFIFFSMNADQYGFSDFGTGYRLYDMLGDRVDLRILEHELGIDAVLYLMRRLNVVVAMRFHACIFAMSQSIPTIGIDYTIGRQGKVGELLVDNGMGDQVGRMDQLESEWLVGQLDAIFQEAEATFKLARQKDAE